MHHNTTTKTTQESKTQPYDAEYRLWISGSLLVGLSWGKASLHNCTLTGKTHIWGFLLFASTLSPAHSLEVKRPAANTVVNQSLLAATQTKHFSSIQMFSSSFCQELQEQHVCAVVPIPAAEAFPSSPWILWAFSNTPNHARCADEQPHLGSLRVTVSGHRLLMWPCSQVPPPPPMTPAIGSSKAFDESQTRLKSESNVELEVEWVVGLGDMD